MSVTNSHERDDRELIRYLVGALTDEDAARLDELSIADDRFAADLHAAEHDLVDAYVRGALEGDTLRRFETHYLASSEGRSKVAFARALRTYPRGRRRLAAYPLLQWGLAAAATVLLAAAGYLFAENGRLKRQQLDAPLRQAHHAALDDLPDAGRHAHGSAQQAIAA